VLIRPTVAYVKELPNRILRKSPINFDGGHTLAAIVVATVEQNRYIVTLGQVEKSVFVKKGIGFLADLLAGVEEVGLQVFE